MSTLPCVLRVQLDVGQKNLKDSLIEVTGTLYTDPKFYKEEECVLIYKLDVESVKKVELKSGKKGMPF